MKATPAGGLLVGLAIAAVIGAVVWAAIRGQGKDWEVAAEIDRGVMTDYCRLVGEGRYGEAWETCLTASYREEVPREKFVAAHEKRRREAGPLGGAKLLRHSVHRNLFSKTRELQLLYKLSYPTGAQPQVAVVNDADGTFRIEGTYHETGDTLGFLLW